MPILSCSCANAGVNAAQNASRTVKLRSTWRIQPAFLSASALVPPLPVLGNSPRSVDTRASLLFERNDLHKLPSMSQTRCGAATIDQPVRKREGAGASLP